jgi:hypothetical protein
MIRTTLVVVVDLTAQWSIIERGIIYMKRQTGKERERMGT